MIVLYWLDFSTTVIFVLEAALKIIALGLYFNGPWAYLKQVWNVIDFIIIVMSILSLSPTTNSLSSFKMLRIFRALRLITKSDGLKVAVSALLQAIPNVANVTIIMLLFFSIFGVISVSFFKGKLYNCVSDHTPGNLEVNSKWDCLDAGGEWVGQVFTFDNLPNALVTLFVMATTAGWAFTVIATIGTSEIDYVPTNGRNPAWIAFYILFMLVGCFFFLNLFVGVVVSNFNTEHEKLGGNNLLTEKQREWIDLKLLVLRSQPLAKLKAPPSRFRSFLFRVYERP